MASYNQDRDDCYLMKSDYIMNEMTSVAGIRPIITIRKDALIKTGTGVEENPYILGTPLSVNTKVIEGSGFISPSVNDLFEGENYEIKIEPSEGYKINKFLVNDEDKTNELVNNTYNITNITEDYDVNVSFTLINESQETKPDDSDEKEKEETVENPKTGIYNYIGVSLLIGIFSILSYNFLKKKNLFKKV